VNQPWLKRVTAESTRQNATAAVAGATAMAINRDRVVQRFYYVERDAVMGEACVDRKMVMRVRWVKGVK
jgi:hypothetical protein